MNSELEAAGALATAGLAAAEIEGAAVPQSAGAPAHATLCANCGAALGGAFCQACGQSAHVHRSLLHLAEEVLHGVLHFDAKGWRTLPLLVFRPGLLTRRYIDGQRARHVSPLALFLFSVFLMFFVFSLTSSWLFGVNTSGSVDGTDARTELAAEVAEATQAMARSEAALASAHKSGQGVAEAEAELSAAKVDRRAVALALAAFDAAVAQPPATPASAAAGEAAPNGGPKILATLNVNTGIASLDAALKRAQGNPELTLYKLKNSAYKFSFLLVPISLPFLWLMFFLRPGIAMYDHAVFSLYSLSFMSVLFIALALLAPLQAHGVQAFLLFGVAPLHMFMHLLETYRLGFIAALWRTVTLLFMCGLVFALFLLFIIVVAV